MDGLLTHKDAEQELRNLYNNLTPQEQQEFQLPIFFNDALYKQVLTLKSLQELESKLKKFYDKL